MEQLRQQQAQQQQQHQQQKRDSLHSISQFSDSPLLCGGGASDAGACPAGRDKLSSWNGDEEDDEAGATEGRQRTTWVTFDISDDDDDALGADENSDDDDNDDNRCSKMTANGSGDKNGECSTRTKKATAEASGATTTATTPIDSSFDDATTTTTASEFEDATSNAWDSRQEDTSLEYAKSVASVESAGGSVHNNGRRPMAPEVDAARAATRQASNESVMDSDLRSANRRSLRRALDLSMQSTDESAVSLNRRAAANGWSAHRSVSSRSNLSHTFADQQSTGAFPQSGTLRPVSSSSLAASMMTNEEPTLSTNHCNSPGSAMQTSGRCQQQQQQQQQANCCHHHYCTPHNRTHRLSSETNDSGLSSCCATASAATESRRSSSTTSAGSGLFAAVRRASGSCGPSHCVEPPMRSQHSSLLVSIVRLPAQQSPKRPASSSAASLMNAFKSLTRSRSADVDATLEQPETGPKIDAATTSGQSESHSEPIYEITLIEAFNLPIYANWSASAASASQSARNTPTRASMQVESMPATPVRPLQGRGGASNDERRRDSLLGSLVGGAASANRSGGGGGGPFKRGGANRHTIAATEAQVGVFVRVFKMTNGASLKPEVGQVEESRSDAQTKKRKRPTDYVELPFVELRRSSATGSELGSNVSFAKRSKEEECDASDERPDQRVSSQSSIASKDQEQRYSITCRESEFPLRVTLYQSSMKRSSSQHQHQHQQTTSARYTLGHCVIEPSDWLDRDDIAAESSITGSGKCTLVQSSSAEGESDSTVMWSQASSLSKDEDHESEGSCNEADNNGPEVERQTNNKQQRVEYRLYATLLEAIKSA